MKLVAHKGVIVHLEAAGKAENVAIKRQCSGKIVGHYEGRDLCDTGHGVRVTQEKQRAKGNLSGRVLAPACPPAL